MTNQIGKNRFKNSCYLTEEKVNFIFVNYYAFNKILDENSYNNLLINNVQLKAISLFDNDKEHYKRFMFIHRDWDIYNLKSYEFLCFGKEKRLCSIIELTDRAILENWPYKFYLQQALLLKKFNLALLQARSLKKFYRERRK